MFTTTSVTRRAVEVNTTIAVIIVFILVPLVALGTRAAYHNGFHDGVKWAAEGEGYPSKPQASWWGYRQLRELLRRPHPPEGS